MDVFDPVLGNGCCTPGAKGITWHPIKTATNGQLALGMTRWIIENKAYNADYLGFTNYKAAVAGGFASYTGATFLVIDDESSANNGKLMTAADAGLTEPEADPAAKTKPTYYVVMDAEKNEAALNTDAERGLIDFEGEVGTAHQGLHDPLPLGQRFPRTHHWAVAESARRAARNDRRRCARVHLPRREGRDDGPRLDRCRQRRELHGRLHLLERSHRLEPDARRHGCPPHRSRYHRRRQAIQAFHHRGQTDARRWEEPARTSAARSAYGRRPTKYKKHIAAGRKDPKPLLPWFSHTGVSDNQALISALCKYPYQAKIVMSWMTNTLQATSGLLRDSVLERMKDTSIIPLHIACDVVIGEHAQYADYIVPDTNPFESFGVVTNEGFFKSKGNSVRWPAKTPETIEISGGRHASFEAFCCDVAKVCDMPGFGDNAVTDVDGKTWPLNDACDFFLKAVANLAYDTTPVDDVAAEDMKLQALDNLPEAWKNAVSEEEWPKVLNVLSRGGRFWPMEDCIGKNGAIKYATDNLTHFYSNRKATDTNPYTGEKLSGTLTNDPERFADNSRSRPLPLEEYPFRSTNYKPRFRSISFLANSPIMRDLCDHNYLELNRDDAKALGIKDGDTIKITNPSGDVMEGEAMVRGGIAEGTFGVAYGYGHRAYGAQDVTIEGEETRKGDPAIGSGIHLQTMLDPTISEIYPLADPEGTSPGRSGGMYKIEKA